MNVLSKLTIKNLKLNRTRTLVTLVGIILSTALLVALMGLVSSFLHTMLIDTIEFSGDHHITIDESIPVDELDEVIYYKDVEKYYLAEYVDYYTFEDPYNESDMYSESILAMDENTLVNNEDRVQSGRLPENENEVIVSMYLENGLGIGDEIKSDAGEVYTIVGTFSFLKNFSSEVVTYMEEPTESAMVALRYKDPTDYQAITASIMGTEKDTDEGKYAYYYNTSLLQLEGNAISSENQRMIYSMALVIAFIVVMTSVFCIRNSFAISITEKTRQYGMLASVGATPKQIRKNVLFEGTVLGAIGIPIGVASGIFAVWVLLMVTNYLMPMVDTAFILDIQILPTVCAILLSGLTIYFSAISSAIRAGRISEIDAIRSTHDIKFKAKSVRTPKWIEKLFKVGGIFAYKNMKRNKSKFRTTTISLIVSIATYVALSSFLNLGFQMANEQYQQMGYNFVISNIPATIDQEQFYEEVSQMAEYDLMSFSKMDSLRIEKTYFSEQGQSLYGDMTMGYIAVMGLEDEYFLSYQKSTGLEENLEQGVILDYEYFDNDDGMQELMQVLAFENTEILQLSNSETPEEVIEISVVRGTDTPIGGYSNYTVLYIANSQFAEIYGEDYTSTMDIYVESQDPDLLDEQMEAYQKENDVSFYTVNLVEQQRLSENMLLLIAIFLYGFITVIILVGLTNIFNSLSTNMNLRRKEFATLQSIGMTSKEFGRMITFESIVYAAKSLLWGIPLGLLGSYALYFASTQGDMSMTYNLPLVQILQSAIVVFLVVYGIMKTSLSKIAKQNIIETIRNENI